MTSKAKIKAAGTDRLRVIHYPDPRLRETATEIESVDDGVRRLAEKMFELMAAARGVGLAAPQVGVTVRLFVASPSCDPSDRHVYVNPKIIATEGSQEGDEGCLSFPGVTCKIKRPNVAVIRAVDLDGRTFEKTAEGLEARIFLHEIDHLSGTLLVDRMGSVAKLAHRRTLKELEEDFAQTT